ncbi:hypothetical protein [Lewinella sp. LCG006]|uniref:hypothetical protein n=1 Tax=Lewinella sp. LCG006 TaxID=3231911 RepID=UPI00345F9780
MKYIITFTLFLATLLLSAQDCQMVSLKLPIPEGVSKHHFPAQAMPASATESFFTYLSEWNQGELVVKMRFSKDGQEWTSWEVLKKDYTAPSAKNSPLHIADNDYEFFEWAVYNKAGLETELALNFYYPTEAPVFANINAAYSVEVAMVGCPQPTMVAVDTESVIVGNNEDK